MTFTDFLSNINYYKSAKLGGQKSQFKLAPKLRLRFSDEQILQQNPKKAAVLILFYPDSNHETRVLLTKRASYKGVHSKQISFPGGKIEADESPVNAAIRETWEEVGIIQESVNVIRQMSDTYIPPSNFLVYPFLGFVNSKPRFKLNYEVEELIELPLNELLSETNLSSVEIETSYMNKIEVPCFKFNNNIVWGATAMMLSEVKDLLLNS